MVSGDRMLGSPLLRTQHLIGASKWKKSLDTAVIAYYQLHSSQTWYENVGFKVIKDESTRRVTIRHTFWYINGTWKPEALSLACAGIGVFLECERSIYVKDTVLASNIAISLTAQK